MFEIRRLLVYSVQGFMMILAASSLVAAETMKELLHREGIPLQSCRTGDLDKQATSGAVLDAKDSRVVVTYAEDGMYLSNSFYVFRLDKRHQKWSGAEVVWPEERPRFGNHHCDPELFNNSLMGEFSAEEASDSLAFTTNFSDVTPEHPNVVYIYRRVSDPNRMQYREFLLSDFRKKYGDKPLKDYLTQPMLRVLFAESRAR